MLMLVRLLGSRALISIAGTVIVAVLTVAGYLLYTGPTHSMRTYCAIMPDTVGLYPQSKVTLRGIAVGAVKEITYQGDSVRVEFTVADHHRLGAELSATTVADSIVADRDLALLSENSETPWDPATCITRTLTPKSMSRALQALTDLSQQLGDSEGQGPGIGAALRTLDHASTGTGDQINTVITTLGAALSNPDVGIARLGRIIDALSSLAASANRGWTEIGAMFTRFSATFQVLDNQLFPMVVELGDALRRVLPMLNDLSMLAGGQLIGGLDAVVPLLRWASVNVGGMQEILQMIPALAGGFSNVVDPDSGAITVHYAAPRIALNATDAAPVCAALQALSPGLCDPSAATPHIDLAQLVLGSAVTR